MKAPKIIEELDYERIVSELKEDYASKFEERPQLLESDNYSKLIECFAYREINLRADINRRVRGLLIDYATGADLDHLCLTLYRIERLQGVRPRARVKFTLAAERSAISVIPAGALLHSKNAAVAELAGDVVIAAGEKEAEGELILREYVSASKERCELLQNELPFVAQPSQMEDFHSGAGVEDDEAFRERAKLSIHKYSTAGAPKAYIYHAKAADVRVQDVRVIDHPEGCRVDVIIKVADEAPGVDEIVAAYLGDDERKPLNALITVKYARAKEVVVRAVVYLADMAAANSYKVSEHEFKIGESYAISKIYAALQCPTGNSLALAGDFAGASAKSASMNSHVLSSADFASQPTNSPRDSVANFTTADAAAVVKVELSELPDLSCGADEYLKLRYELTFEAAK